MKTETFENFPWWIVVVCNAVGAAIYGIGFFIMLRLGIVWGALYAAYCVWLEWRLLSGSCRSCYYYGKICGFGKGRLCSWFFSRRPEKAMSNNTISCLSILPDFMVSLVPLGVAIVLVVRNFSWVILLLALVLAGLASAGTGFVRGQLACKHCRQRELGCPAEQLFSKTRKA